MPILTGTVWRKWGSAPNMPITCCGRTANWYTEAVAPDRAGRRSRCCGSQEAQRCRLRCSVRLLESRFVVQVVSLRSVSRARYACFVPHKAPILAAPVLHPRQVNKYPFVRSSRFWEPADIGGDVQSEAATWLDSSPTNKEAAKESDCSAADTTPSARSGTGTAVRISTSVPASSSPRTKSRLI